MEGNLGTSGRTSFKPWPICLKISTIIYFSHTRMVVRPNLLFSSRIIGKRDVPGTAGEEEKVYL